MRLIALLILLVPALAWAGNGIEDDTDLPCVNTAYVDEQGRQHLVIDTFSAMLFRGLIETGVVVMNITHVGTGEPAYGSGPANNKQASPGPGAPQPGAWLKIASMDTKIVETNAVWTKISWSASVKNPTDTPLSGYIEVQAVDGAGFVIDSHFGVAVSLAGGEERSYSDYVLIGSSIIEQVATIKIVLST